MSQYFWKEHPISYMELFGGKVTVFNSVTNKVKLCIQDKFYIVLKTEKASVNSRNLFYNGPFLFL